MSANFKLYSKYYNLLYADKDYAGEVNYLRKLLQKYAPSAKQILEFGSGTGVHGLKMMEAGFNVFGIERSESMVAEAKAKGFPCKVADITDFTLDKKFDAVISLFHVISYQTENKQLIRAFRNAYDHLNDEGIFIFDVWYSPAVHTLKAVPRIKRMHDKEVSVIRFAEPVVDVNSNVIDVQFTVLVNDLRSNETEEIKESHPMRHFSLPEIELLAELTGFDILKAEEFLSGKDAGENTWGVCFILKKK